MDIKEIRKELNLSQDKIAEAFGYKDGGSYARATRKQHIDNGIKVIYELTKKKFQIIENQVKTEVAKK